MVVVVVMMMMMLIRMIKKRDANKEKEESRPGRVAEQVARGGGLHTEDR
jgi:hypothetical protein